MLPEFIRPYGVQNILLQTSSWEDWAKETIADNSGKPAQITVHIICSDSVGSPFVESLIFRFSIRFHFIGEYILSLTILMDLVFWVQMEEGFLENCLSIQQVKLNCLVLP